jgi:CDP-paratose 2-epimerase
MPKRILVTGGAGFAGSSLCLALKKNDPGAVVIAFDNLHRRGSELNLPGLRAAGVEFLHGDVRSPEDLAAAGPPSLIVECSAEPSAQAGYGGAPDYLIETNLVGCYHCLELARRAQSDFLFLSTSRVYPYRLLNQLEFFEDESRFRLADRQSIDGSSAAGVAEDFPLKGSRSLYGMTKLASELMVEEYADAYGLRCVINRCGLLSGPGQMGKSDQGVIALWMAHHYFRRPLRYIGFGGLGKQVRDFLHIADLCDLVIEQIGDFERYRGQVFNVGGGAEYSLSLAECTTLCREITGNSILIASEAGVRPADVRIYISDTTKLRAVAGWSPKLGAKALLTDIFDWIQKDEAALKPLLAGA